MFCFGEECEAERTNTEAREGEDGGKGGGGDEAVKYGQLYVATSTITSRNGLKILLIDENGVCIDSTSNAAFKGIFRNMYTQKTSITITL
ncbi:hypothetical protein MTR_4g014550 [Medicago truncatula]|uniref:Uncharacterized protein n=1 Tax=Medicago truncatula TaxID=3880 RepID=G7JLS8_MEDTR|nr:hypothetical protein MTR_4g014550 [Medicago truncatula]